MTPQRRFTVNLSSSGNGPKFNVVVAYDNDTGSSPAMKTCDYVIRQLGSDVPVRRTVLNFGEKRPDRSSAARSAAKADMVIVATGNEDRLSPEMQDWLDEWTHRRPEGEGALVAVLNPRNVSPIREQLRQAAAAAHMDFFSSEVAAQ
jgi:hypothetical protein